MLPLTSQFPGSHDFVEETLAVAIGLLESRPWIRLSRSGQPPKISHGLIVSTEDGDHLPWAQQFSSLGHTFSHATDKNADVRPRYLSDAHLRQSIATCIVQESNDVICASPVTLNLIVDLSRQRESLEIFTSASLKAEYCLLRISDNADHCPCTRNPSRHLCLNRTCVLKFVNKQVWKTSCQKRQ
jgi:hypothetical protein